MPLRVKSDKGGTFPVRGDLIDRLIQGGRGIEFPCERTAPRPKTRIDTDAADFLLAQTRQGAKDAHRVIILRIDPLDHVVFEPTLFTDLWLRERKDLPTKQTKILRRNIEAGADRHHFIGVHQY